MTLGEVLEVIRGDEWVRFCESEGLRALARLGNGAQSRGHFVEYSCRTHIEWEKSKARVGA